MLSRDSGIQTNVFYMDEDAINCTVQFSDIIRDLTLNIQCICVEGEEDLSNTVVSQDTRRLVNTNRLDISFSRTGLYWPRGSYLIVVSHGQDELIRASFEVTIPSAPTINIQKTDLELTGENDKITKTYSWDYKDIPFQYEFKVSKSIYDYYKNKPPFFTHDPTDYAIYATDPYDDSFINGLVNAFLEKSAALGFDKFDTLGLIVSFVQSLPFVDDRIAYGYEHPKYPIETLIEEGGDCEDTSILISSILDAMGIVNALLIFPTHCAVGVGATGLQGKFYQYEGINYYYLESANLGTLGAIPEELINVTPSIVPLISKPVIVHDTDYSELGKVIKLEVKVLNLGSSTSKALKCTAGFQTENPDFDYYQESDSFQLDTNETAKLIFYLEFPFRTENRIVVKTFHDEEVSYYTDDIYWYKKPNS